MTTQASAEVWKELYETAVRHAAEWRENFEVLQHALVGETGASGITVAHQLSKDAARYRWLRDKGSNTWVPFTGQWKMDAEHCDAAIDNEMANQRLLGAA